jgi:hypothetical protein
MADHNASGGFPDPRFRLEPEVRARVLPWYDPDALERFLSILPESTRTELLDEFFTRPGGENKSIPQFGGPGFSEPLVREALRAVYAPLHRMNPELKNQFPFAEQDAADSSEDPIL